MMTHFKYLFFASMLVFFSCQGERVLCELDLTSNAIEIEGEVVLQPEVGKDYFLDLTTDKNFFTSCIKTKKEMGC